MSASWMPKAIVVVVAVGALPARADERGAFCEVTPCLPGPVTRTKLAAERKVGTVTCKKGEDIGVDPKQRVQFCTTAKDVDADGIPVAAGSYTLFHPSGRIYQTHARKKFERALKDGSKITCGVDTISIGDDGTLIYCKLGAPRPGSPKAKVGEGIAFHPNGKLLRIVLDEPFTAAGIALTAGSDVVWDEQGRVKGGYSRDETRAGALKIKYEFQVHPNGKVAFVTLIEKAKIAGHDFPDFAKLKFRDDGSLEAAEYVEQRGFMIHGEPWEDTRTMTFDKSGKVTSTNLEHYQAKDPPPKFRK